MLTLQAKGWGYSPPPPLDTLLTERVTARPTFTRPCLFYIHNHYYMLHRPVGQVVRNAFISGTRGQWFKSRSGQIEHGVANGSPPMRHFFERAVLPARNDEETGSAN